LELHEPLCDPEGDEAPTIVMPDEPELMFKDISQGVRFPYVIYGDFECYIEDNQHVPSGFSYKVVTTTKDEFWPTEKFTGLNASTEFVKSIEKTGETIIGKMKLIKEIEWNDDLRELFEEETMCHICKKELGEDRVRDHDHISGEYRGAAHNKCNINFRKKLFVPCIFHGGKNYDFHIIVKALEAIPGCKVEVLAINMEKFISFSVGNIRFLDSYQFMNSSLAKLVENLPKDRLIHTQQYLNHHYGSSDGLELLTRKGVFPYSYFTSMDILELTQLPPQAAFKNDLTARDISNDDYQHAQKVWNHFEMTTFRQYHDLYLDTDVHLLADVFECFRDLCLDTYQLDPPHFYTAPGLAWQAALKYTDIKLELFTDQEKYEFIENAIRGGVTMTCHRLATANNPLVPNYDPEEENSYIIYLDANNLYGWAMSQPLPTGSFKFMDAEEIANVDFTSIPDDNETGYILEVDMEYPVHLHKDHSDFPLAPEPLTITEDMLSPYASKLAQKVKCTTGGTKLTPNLMNKCNYVLHYRNLKLYHKLGMKITKIHNAMSFLQSPWLKPYIELNTNMRSKAKNAFEKDYFKLMNNAVFGKTLEQVRKHRDFHIVTNEKQARKLVNKPEFKDYVILGNNVVLIEMKRRKIKLNKPVYTGFSILDISKTLMYEFHYDFIKAKYDDKAKLCYTDTDSFIYWIKTEDLYKDMLQHSDLFDFSDYPEHHELYSTKNKKVIGKMKCETRGEPIEQFVGLRAKMYSIRTATSEHKKAKGVQISAVEDRITHDDYVQTIVNSSNTSVDVCSIRSFEHKIQTYPQRKVALSAFEDKRFLLQNGISSLPYGHKDINK